MNLTQSDNNHPKYVPDAKSQKADFIPVLKRSITQRRTKRVWSGPHAARYGNDIVMYANV